MTGRIVRPTEQANAAVQDRRLDRLERRVFWRPGQSATMTPWREVFSQAGLVSIATSGNVDMAAPTTITEIVATLRVAGSTTTTAQLLRDGSSSGMPSVSLTAGQGEVHADVGVTLDAGENLSVESTAAGTGASDLVIELRGFR